MILSVELMNTVRFQDIGHQEMELGTSVKFGNLLILISVKNQPKFE